MALLSFTDAQIHAEAVRLGLIYPSQALPQDLRSQVVASLARPQPQEPAADDEPAAPDADAVLTVYAQGPVLLNGRPFPLYVATEPIEVVTRPDGQITVNLTVVVGACHLLPGSPD